MDDTRVDLIASIRSEYMARPFTEAEVDRDPIAQFRAWFGEALDAQVPEPTAMTLATAGREGAPSARIMLLKGVDERGFVFYTNYDSRKAGELTESGRAALVFFWVALHRQVRVEGRVERVTDAESDVYFASRPRGSQIGARASIQSHAIASREALEARVREVEAEFEGREVPRPPNWGGFRVVPDAIEFWQGRENRLHDRLRFRRGPQGSWALERLAP
jgi:pyridoxamine 5'-phosphate oxidase